MYFTGIIIALSTFLIIGIFHPIVVKTEYYFGTRFWFVFLILGIISIIALCGPHYLVIPAWCARCFTALEYR